MNEVAFHPLHEAFDAVAAWLQGIPDAEPVSTNADRLATLFGLGTYERNVILLAAYVALEAEAGNHLAALHGAEDRRHLVVSTLLSKVPGANWSALAADAPLRRHRLIELAPGPSLASQQIVLAESVLFFLLGAPALSPSMADSVGIVVSEPRLSPARRKMADRIARLWSVSTPQLLMLTGKDAEGKIQAMKAACDHTGSSLCLLHASMLPPATSDLLAFARMLERDVTLMGGRLLLRLESQSEEALARVLVQALGLPITVACDEPLVFPGKTAARMEMPRMKAAEQSEVWQSHLGKDGDELQATIRDLAQHFRVTPELANSVRNALAAQDEDENGSDLRERVWMTCRESVRPRMNELAERIESNTQWDDLVLPAKQKDVLADLVGQARNSALVYEEWGFGAKLQDRGLGISALLAGPSGAGKTMAGEVIANALNLDLYRIDLSSVVSKWLGETEKNIRRLFDAAEEGGVVMQFDEADALFGKRSEVKDSHDRHANIEVSYLLQKLEAFRGIAILTTNLKENIDQAFLRRIRFILDFRFPAVREREEIWRRIFPEQVPLDSLDYAALARLNIAGGTIRNIALAASFRAAREGASVNMRRIYDSARVEYDKTGKIMTDQEVMGWAV